MLKYHNLLYKCQNCDKLICGYEALIHKQSCPVKNEIKNIIIEKK